MRGIDISNYQAGLTLDNVSCDFAIIKATEDTNFVDPYCDGFVQDAKRLGMLWGVYHFARYGSAAAQARFFIENCRGYIGEGILVLDIEDNSIPDWAAFATDFCDEVERLTGVTPMIYCSASELQRFRGSNIPNRCGLWCAGYPYPSTVWANDTCTYCLDPWQYVCIWQFTSCLACDGYSIDGDYAYITSEQWDAYAQGWLKGQKGQKAPEPYTQEKDRDRATIDHLAREVMAGKWGNDPERKRALESCGYDYQAVQNRVNEYFDTANACIRGDYGNGVEREERLALAGFNPSDVQQLVNLLMR
jgi:GH25 family lysozyme M1 (1,4-beta-N-acetylmuramidase)